MQQEPEKIQLGSVEYQLFPESYFSGCDVALYIGDKWVDEIVSINFTLAEQVQPIFGYNSYTYDDVARGTRIIQGNIRINFVEASYLYDILKTETGKTSTNKAYMTHPEIRGSSSMEPKVDEILEKLKTASKEEKKSYMESRQKTIWWGKGSKYNLGSENDSVPYFPKNTTGVLFTIVYGTPGAFTDGSTVKQLTSIPGSFKRVTGVQFNGCSQIVNADGVPIYEDYTFLARDLN